MAMDGAPPKDALIVDNVPDAGEAKQALPFVPPTLAPDQSRKAVYVWAEGLDASNKKARGILSGLKLLQEFHEQSGHRSAEHTALQYEWVHGAHLPIEAIENQPRCSACDMAKATNDSFRKTPLQTECEIGEIVAADTICDLARSHNGYRYIGHYHDKASDYGAITMSRTKSLADKFLYFAKWLSNTVGRHGGEFLSDAMRAVAKEHGVQIIANLASVHSNTSIERRHRTLQEIMNAFLLNGHAGRTCGSTLPLQQARSST